MKTYSYYTYTLSKQNIVDKINGWCKTNIDINHSILTDKFCNKFVNNLGDYLDYHDYDFNNDGINDHTYDWYFDTMERLIKPKITGITFIPPNGYILIIGDEKQWF